MTDKFTQKTLEALQSAQGMAIENENMQIARLSISSMRLPIRTAV